jgi:primosomal protein N' (replication factor Y)
MEQPELIGVRALVPFGKRVLTGVIVECDVVVPQKDIRTIKPVLELLDNEPAFSPLMLAFTQWVAEYYCASWGETLKAALPQGMTVESVVRVSAVRDVSDAELVEMQRRAPRRAELLRHLLAHRGDVSVGYLENVVSASGQVAAQLEALEELGYIERRRFIGKEIKPKQQKAVQLSSALAYDESALRSVLDELDRTAPKQAALLSTIWVQTQHSSRPLVLREALRLSGSSDAALKALVQKGYVVEHTVEVMRTDSALQATSDTSPESPSYAAQALVQKDENNLDLTTEQAHAVSKIIEALLSAHSPSSAQHNLSYTLPINPPKAKTFLLRGVTGSGKTVVYIQVIRQALALGKSVLLLVPEISLTPQLIERFRAVFGTDIGVMHSHTSAGERYDAWRRAKRGEIRLIIGARSAIFAPLRHLGVIIVDEEHEPSYKQDDPAPRYNARDIAVVRGTMEHAIVVLGSATPSLESLFNAHHGKYHLLDIRHRADGAQLPSIRVINTIEARKRRQMESVFSKELLNAIADRVERCEGVILFHNRRGFASRLECMDCGHIPMCPHCAVALTYHKSREQLRCHYCGYSRKAEAACTECGSLAVRDIGSGTQRIEEELQPLLESILAERMPTAPRKPVIQRMDLDTTSIKGAHKKMLIDFANGKIDVLVGTQMVAKGLDFARVTLVGVINADMQLYLPDFRAAERTFQLLTQVSGRAGRSSELRGEVIIQTAHPVHQTILAASTGQHELFYHDELQTRKDVGYPPFTRFVVIEFSGREEQLVHHQAQHFAFYLPAQHKAFTRLGPALPSIPRLRSLYRRVIVLKGNKEVDPSGKALREALRTAQTQYNLKHPSSAVHITIDIDASGFL